MLTVASFFAGVGGIDLGFEKAGFKTIYANEFDNYAADTFELNFDVTVDRRDINTVPAEDIPNFDVMLAADYGNIPQNRERIYIVAFRDKEDYADFDLPKSIPLETSIKDVIDFDSKVDDKFYYTAEKNKFFDELKENMTKSDTTYQWRRVYVRENKSNLVPTLTANMGTGGHNVPLILTNSKEIRKLTPRECFNVQGFPKDYKLPEQSNGRLYKQAGNSVTVPVIERIAKNIAKAIN